MDANYEFLEDVMKVENIRNEVATEGIIEMAWEAFVSGNAKKLSLCNKVLRFHFPFAS